MAKRFPTSKDDLELIQRVQKDGDNDAMKELITQHSGVFRSILDSSLTSDYDVFKQEIQEDKNYHLYRLAMNYDPSKNMKYPTWVGQNVKWMCMNIVNRSRVGEMLEEASFDRSYEQQFEDVEQIALDELKNLAEKYPDKRIERVITGRYFNGRRPLSWKRLAKKLQSSPKNLLTLHDKFLEWAKPKMKKYA